MGTTPGYRRGDAVVTDAAGREVVILAMAWQEMKPLAGGFAERGGAGYFQ